mgnify:CR=1 FL=1
MCSSDLFLFSFTSDEFDVYHINDFMRPKGWRFNGQQYPNALHMAVTRPQTQEGVVEAFVADLSAAGATSFGAVGANFGAALDESGTLTVTVQGFVSSRYLRFFHPEELGGLGLGSEDLVVALELLGAACPALAWKATVSANICGRVLAQHGSAEHRARWLAPILSGDKVASIGIVESVGSDLGSNTTVATRVGGE